MFHKKIWSHKLCTMIKKCASSKQNLNKMMNVYKLCVSIREEEEIPYPRSPPPLTIITTNHHDESI